MSDSSYEIASLPCDILELLDAVRSRYDAAVKKAESARAKGQPDQMHRFLNRADAYAEILAVAGVVVTEHEGW